MLAVQEGAFQVWLSADVNHSNLQVIRNMARIVAVCVEVEPLLLRSEDVFADLPFLVHCRGSAQSPYPYSRRGYTPRRLQSAGAVIKTARAGSYPPRERSPSKVRTWRALMVCTSGVLTYATSPFSRASTVTKVEHMQIDPEHHRYLNTSHRRYDPLHCATRTPRQLPHFLTSSRTWTAFGS